MPVNKAPRGILPPEDPDDDEDDDEDDKQCMIYSNILQEGI